MESGNASAFAGPEPIGFLHAEIAFYVVSCFRGESLRPRSNLSSSLGPPRWFWWGGGGINAGLNDFLDTCQFPVVTLAARKTTFDNLGVDSM